MEKTITAENVAKSIVAQSLHANASISKPVERVQSVRTVCGTPTLNKIDQTGRRRCARRRKGQNKDIKVRER